MRLKRIAGLLIPGLVVLGACSGVDLESPGLVKVSKHGYAFIASGPSADQGLGANSGFVIGTEGVLVVDSRYTPALARELLQAIRSVTDKKILYVVNTHYHPDHTWGNEVFKAEGAIFVSRAETRRDLEKYSPGYFDYYKQWNKDTYEKIKDVKLVLPDTTFDEELTLDLGGVTVVLQYFGAAHTPGDCIVISEDIAFTGGVVSNGYHPNLGDPGVDIDNWLEVLSRLQDLHLRYVIPGQGYASGPEVIERQIDYIISLRNSCTRGIKGGVPLEIAMKAITVPGTEEYLQSNILKFNIQAVYRREIPNIVRPDFTFDLPEGYAVTDGGGSPGRGSIKWSLFSGDGAFMIKVKWWGTPPIEIIPQDIFGQVSREVAAREMLEMEIEGTRRLDVGDEKAIAAYGKWVYRGEGLLEGLGPWVWAMLKRGDKVYLVQLSANAEGVEVREQRIMEELERIAKTFKTEKK